ncbi:hypothetical protein ACUOA8_59320, partial [Escherichia sp. SS-MK2]
CYFDEEGVGGGFGGGKGFVDLTNPVKRIEGSSRNVIDPFESIVKHTFKSMQAIESFPHTFFIKVAIEWHVVWVFSPHDS